MPVLQNTSRLAVVTGGGDGLRLRRKLIFAMFWRLEQGPAAAIG